MLVLAMKFSKCARGRREALALLYPGETTDAAPRRERRRDRLGRGLTPPENGTETSVQTTARAALRADCLIVPINPRALRARIDRPVINWESSRDETPQARPRVEQ